jgi:hypothetical protein
MLGMYRRHGDQSYPDLVEIPALMEKFEGAYKVVEATVIKNLMACCLRKREYGTVC